MAATLKTPNYEYPVYAENDTTSWADFNSLADGADRDIHNVSQIVQEEKGKTEELIAEMSEVKEQVARASQDAGEAKSQVAAINIRVENAETHLNDVDNQIELLQAAQETQAGSIASLEHSVNTAEVNITATASNVETLTQRVNNTSDLVGQHGTDIAQLKQDVSGFNGRIEAVESEVQEISGDITSIEADVASTKTNISNMENRINQKITSRSTYTFEATVEDYLTSRKKVVLRALESQINAGEVYIVKIRIDISGYISHPQCLSITAVPNAQSQNKAIGNLVVIQGSERYEGDVLIVLGGSTGNVYCEFVITDANSTDTTISNNFSAEVISATALKIG